MYRYNKPNNYINDSNANITTYAYHSESVVGSESGSLVIPSDSHLSPHLTLCGHRFGQVGDEVHTIIYENKIIKIVGYSRCQYDAYYVSIRFSTLI